MTAKKRYHPGTNGPMSIFLEDIANLKLLKLVCSGVGVEINISELSKILKRHRNTIKDRITKIFAHKIIDKPLYPLSWLRKEYPLLTISRSEFRRDEKTNKFIEKDPQIFAAFFFKEDSYNTLMIEFHKDLFSYELWRENIVEQEKITLRETRYPMDGIHLSTKRIVKYDPAASLQVIGQNIDRGYQTEINGYRIDPLSFRILRLLLNGQGIRTNENLLARNLGIHRRTTQKRLQVLLEEGIISKPVCYFPRVFVPPEYIMVMSFFEIRKRRDVVLKALQDDSHIPMMVKAKVGHFNLFLLSTFYKIEDHLEWQEELDQRFPECIGSAKNTYLSPAMTFGITQEYVSLELIESKLRSVRGKELADTVKSPGDYQ
ncbi:MAG: helix-turn-helix transcriptional regulator [Candidatus Bathyarchaeota archaeon]|nr:MAG: helix-turn-helix transcriptional regulator [Candidatus Bathyarchaeota archaeon]